MRHINAKSIYSLKNVLGKIKVNCKLHDKSVVTDFIIVPLNVNDRR